MQVATELLFNLYYEWLSARFTPYVVVNINYPSVRVPLEHVNPEQTLVIQKIAYRLKPLCAKLSYMVDPHSFSLDKCNLKDTITLNISPNAISQYEQADQAISFNARFRGASRFIYFPMEAIVAIFGRESSMGWIFDKSSTKYSKQKSTENLHNTTPSTKDSSNGPAKFVIVKG